MLRLLHDALLLVYQKRLYDPSSGVLMTPEGKRSIVQFVQPPSARERVAATLRRWQAAYMRGVTTRTRIGSFVHRPLSAFMADTVTITPAPPKPTAYHGSPHDCHARAAKEETLFPWCHKQKD